MFEKLKDIETRYRELESALSDPKVLADHIAFQKTAKAHAELTKIVNSFEAYQRILKEIESVEGLIDSETDEELIELAREEQEVLRTQKERLEQDLKLLLLPRDPNDKKKHHHGDPCRYRWRGSKPVCSRSVPNVLTIC